jgi:YidC/Oxa1 family membrane protein insertase
MQDTGMTKRIFLATFISFVFFMAYDYFVIQPQTTTQTETTTKTTQITNSKTNNTSSVTTNLKEENINKNSDKIIATIKSKNFEIHIDNLGRISQYILEKNIFNDEKGKKTSNSWE